MLEMECSCEQGRHSAPIKTLEIGEGAIEKSRKDFVGISQGICSLR